MASKARDLSNFISTAAIDASEIGTGAITTDKIADTTITHAKLHTTMDLSGKTVTLPTINALDVTNNINVGGTVDGVDVAAAGALATNALPKAGGTMTGNLLVSGAKIGVGTTAPLGQLQVGGSTAVSADSKLVFGKSTAASQDYLPVIQHSSTGGVSNDLVIAATSGDGAIRMYTGASSGSGIFGTTNNDERMRIDSSGNVGIGVTPEAWNTNFTAARLGTRTVLANTTAGNGETTILANNFLNDGSAEQHIQTGPASIYQQYNGTHSFTVIPSAAAGAAASLTTAMTIDNSTKIGINQAPAAHWQMYIKSTIDGNGVLQLERSTNADSTFRSHVLFSRGGSTVGEIKTNHNSTQYNTTSDYRLKENVTPMSGATAQIKLLKPCNFDWKTVGGNVNGFLAHELAEVVPEAVSGTKDAMMDEEYEVTAATDTEAAVMGTRSVPDLQGIDQSKLVPLLTATIQELIARIEALENN